MRIVRGGRPRRGPSGINRLRGWVPLALPVNLAIRDVIECEPINNVPMSFQPRQRRQRLAAHVSPRTAAHKTSTAAERRHRCFVAAPRLEH